MGLFCKIMLIPMSILAGFALFIGIFPQAIIKPILTTVTLFVRVENVLQIMNSVIGIVQALSIIFCIFLVLLIVIIHELGHVYFITKLGYKINKLEIYIVKK